MLNTEIILNNIRQSKLTTGANNYYFDLSHPLKPYAMVAPANPNLLPPANATRVEPTFEDGKVPCWDGEKWVNVVDNREKIIYNKNNGEQETCLTIEVPVTHTLLKPNSEYDFWNGSEWVFDEKVRDTKYLEKRKRDRWLLVQIAKEQIDQIEEIVQLTGNEQYKTLLLEWKTYRAKLNTMDLTSDESFPEEPETIN